jgi:coxsackievirus/adenovirus receptor
MGYFGRTPDCRSCACNGFSNSCDVDTGICFNCTGKTTGSYCDNCEIGYYGDPLSGIHCKKCMCPGVDGIQHAEICKLNKDNDKGICQCKEGYIGEHCDRCDKFYYGNPLDKNIGCKRCDCNNNADERDRASCDAKTGECLNCLYNTDGFNCEKCKYGFYGSAQKKECYVCGCDPRGTIGNTVNNCYHISGQCNCLPNVEGRLCDTPVKRYYWNSNKNGTLACDCDISGTIFGNLICNENTGECPCIGERGDRKCNECADKKWGDPDRIGCKG